MFRDPRGFGDNENMSRSATQKFIEIYRQTRNRHQLLKKASRLEPDLKRQIHQQHVADWAKSVLDIMGVSVNRRGAAITQEPCLFVGNHVSYIDIPLLVAVAPVVFVGKRELGNWPIFGSAMKSLGTVLVNREQSDSRRKAGLEIARTVTKESQSVALFPSGTTTIEESKAWKWGAFQIAARYKIPIQPFVLHYKPVRECAYIDQDFFPTHLYRLMKFKEIQAYLEFHEPVVVDNPRRDCAYWQDWTRDKVREYLRDFQYPVG